MPVRVLGIDPGLTRCGIGIIEQGAGRNVGLVAVDTIRSTPDTELSQRIRLIGDEIEALILEHKPQSIAVERVFAQSNLRSVMGVAQISGVVLLLAARHEIPVALHTPSEVKSAVTGNGRAGKAQVGAMVAQILGLAEIPKPADAADALAIAITHAWRGGVGAAAESVSQAVGVTAAQAQWRAALAASKKTR